MKDWDTELFYGFKKQGIQGVIDLISLIIKNI